MTCSSAPGPCPNSMSAFTGPLSLTQQDLDWKAWQLNSPLVYEVDALGSGKVITVPAGFLTDGASVPRVLWAILPAWGRYSRAAVVHDHLCELIKRGRPHPLSPTFAEAARIFRQAMKVCGVGTLTRWAMWAAVRLHFWLQGRD